MAVGNIHIVHFLFAFSFVILCFPLLLIVLIPEEPSKWQAWGPWTRCSTSCGTGSKIRARACSKNDGSCPGESTEAKDCRVQNQDRCPSSPFLHFYRTYVRSWPCLVSHSVTHSVSHSYFWDLGLFGTDVTVAFEDARVAADDFMGGLCFCCRTKTKAMLMQISKYSNIKKFKHSTLSSRGKLQRKYRVL